MTRSKNSRMTPSDEDLVKSFLKKHYFGDPADSLMLLIFEETVQFYEANKKHIDSWGTDRHDPNDKIRAAAKSALQGARQWWRVDRPKLEKRSSIEAGKASDAASAEERNAAMHRFSLIDGDIDLFDDRFLSMIMSVRPYIWT